ncbi:hypothetical protein MUP38_08600 [Candidatus Bathyarchaeota archaeon]|nr:hypothetical protein [Candidatus Bathyarchaeota archaeon]
MYTSTYPVVPEEPVTVKPSSWLVELNAKLDTVEFDETEKTFHEGRRKTASCILAS